MTFAICSGVLFYVLLTHLHVIWNSYLTIYNFIRPVFIGLIIAYILNPLAKAIHRYLLRRTDDDYTHWTLSTIASVILVLALFSLLMIALIPQLITSVINLVRNSDNYATALDGYLAQWEGTASSHNIDISSVSNIAQNLISQASSFLNAHADRIVSTITQVGTGIFTTVISFIIAIYFLMDKERLSAGFIKLMQLAIPEKRYPSVATFWSRCHVILVRFINYDLLDGLIIGFANYFFMTIMGMPYAALLSVVVGVTNLAPTFGPIVGGAFGAFILLLENPWNALWFLIFTIVLQTIDGYIIKPRLFGNALDVPPIWILAMVIIGGRMFGVPGILMAIPVAAILNFAYHDYLVPNLTHRREKQQAAAEEYEFPEQ